MAGRVEVFRRGALEWIVRDADGRDLSFASEDAATIIGRSVARMSRQDLLICGRDGKLRRERFASHWIDYICALAKRTS